MLVFLDPLLSDTYILLLLFFFFPSLLFLSLLLVFFFMALGFLRGDRESNESFVLSHMGMGMTVTGRVWFREWEGKD